MSENKPGGYNGKILRVNLSNSRITTEDIDEQFCRRYLGGAGFVTYYLWKELKPGIDPLSPLNKLVFAMGPVSGLSFPGAARYCTGAKSPMTGGLAKSESGGYWMAEFKRAGFDALIVEGKADIPVYIFIKDGEVIIKDAGHLWGKETKETEKVIKTELGDDHIRVAMIGPGGENLVRYACIMNGCFDVSGRGGLGAVMGSKNLKAIAVRGHKLPEISNPERIKEMRQELLERKWPMSEYGTGGPEMELHEKAGNLPIRNFQDGLFPTYTNIYGPTIKETIRVGMDGCYACPVRCKKAVEFKEPYPCDSAYGGPEYETLAAFGPNCGIDDLKAIAKANERCNAYSLDTISTGLTIAFAMECFEKGLLTAIDTDGLDLRFGNAAALVQCVELIAKKEGFGKLLAEGSARMAKQIGKGSIDFAIQVKGLEAGLHEPRLSQNMGLGFMLSPQGAEHGVVSPEFFFAWPGMKDELEPLGFSELPSEMGARKVALFKLLQCKGISQDSMSVCIFLRFTLQKQAEIVSAVTGWNTSAAELLRISERIITIQRLFLVQEGFTASDDMLPDRFFHPKTNGKPTTSLDKDKINKARLYYYTLMGWDSNGVPLPEKVDELYIE